MLKKLYEWISDQEIEVLDEPSNFKACMKAFGLGALHGLLEFFLAFGIFMYVLLMILGIKSKLSKNTIQTE